jgi:hypothetical protein
LVSIKEHGMVVSCTNHYAPLLSEVIKEMPNFITLAYFYNQQSSLNYFEHGGSSFFVDTATSAGISRK